MRSRSPLHCARRALHDARTPNTHTCCSLCAAPCVCVAPRDSCGRNNSLTSLCRVAARAIPTCYYITCFPSVIDKNSCTTRLDLEVRHATTPHLRTIGMYCTAHSKIAHASYPGTVRWVKSGLHLETFVSWPTRRIVSLVSVYVANDGVDAHSLAGHVTV